MAIAERWKGHPELPDDLEERFEHLVARLRWAGAKLVYLFGSAARPQGDEPRRPGDADLAVWGMEEDPWRVRADLEEILETDRLDLLIMEDAEPELAFEIVARGRRLHADTRDVENRVELEILRRYRDLAPLRNVQRNYLRARHGLDGS